MLLFAKRFPPQQSFMASFLYQKGERKKKREKKKLDSYAKPTCYSNSRKTKEEQNKKNHVLLCSVLQKK
jgi:hypothetical protein